MRTQLLLQRRMLPALAFLFLYILVALFVSRDVVRQGQIREGDLPSIIDKPTSSLSSERISTNASNVTRKDNRANTSPVSDIIRYDTAGNFSIFHSSIHTTLPCIPESRRILPSQRHNLTYHIQQRTNSSTTLMHENNSPHPNYDISQDSRTLYLYNPSLVALPRELWPPRLLQSTNDNETDMYLATFRLYLGSNCFGPNPQRLLMKAGEQANLLGVALLDATTMAVRQSIVVDINAGPLPPDAAVNFYWKSFRQPLEDCRVFVRIEQDQRSVLQLVCNAIGLTIQLTDAEAATTNTRGTGSKVENGDIVYPYVYPNLYSDADAFSMALVEPPTLLVHGKEAKNMNIFHALNNEKQQQAYLQVYPQPHWYQEWGEGTAAQQAPVRGEMKSSFRTPDASYTILASEQQLGRGSNRTVVEQPFLPPSNDRGTACCIQLELPLLSNTATTQTTTTVLVGLTHTKLPGRQNPYWERDKRHRYHANTTTTWGWNRYLSRFVAYQAQPPFGVVAQSGWLCLHFGGVHDTLHGPLNVLDGPMRGAALDVFGTTYQDCPAIHFASSITSSATNVSQAVIGYGVNDCYARFVVVEKEEIAERLLHLDRR